MQTIKVHNAQRHQNYLAAHLTPSSPQLSTFAAGLQGRFHLGGADSVLAHQKALGTLYRAMQQQATLLAYIDNFRFLGYLSMACIPLILLFHRARKQKSASAPMEH